MSNDIEGKSIRLVLIDHDEIFLLGLGTFLAQFSEFEVVAKFSRVAEALPGLAAIASNPESADKSIDVVILDVGSDPAGQENLPLALIQELHRQYPDLPLLLLDSLLTAEDLNPARQAGVKGYFPKGTNPETLVNAIRQIIAGNDWVAPEIPALLNQMPPAANSNRVATLWAQNLRLSADRQINHQIFELDAQLKHPNLSEFDRFFILGRQRELRAASWLIDGILQVLAASDTPSNLKKQVESANNISWLSAPESSDLTIPGAKDLDRSQPISDIEFKTIQSELFDRILVKFQSRLLNLTDIPLEFDILKLEKQQQLLYLILRQFEELLENLRYSQVQYSSLIDKRDPLLLDLYQATINEFFGKYASLGVDNQEISIVPVLMEDAEIVKSSILDKIPQVSELLAYVLFKTPLTIENRAYPPDSLEAIIQAEALLENLIIQMANAVIYPLLNRFADVEEIKQEFYDRRWMTTRELERFRNNLSWRYRWEKYWTEPKAIFESQYVLLVLDERGIRKMTSYAPRRAELNQLNGIQQTVTLLLETRDAIAPRVQSMLVFVGSGGRYVLIQLGRGIGLIAQGIIQGIGNSLQDLKTGKRREP
jgi:DNA-binding NarL/FixJ family response regulator